MEKWNAEELWSKYQTGKATDEEKAIVERWYNNIDGPVPDHERQMQAMKMVAARLPINRPGAKIIRFWYGIAAAIILVSAVGLYLFHAVHYGPRRQAGQYAAGIKPGALAVKRLYTNIAQAKQ